LDKSVDAVVDCMNALGRPVVSGKDSLSSTYRGKDGQIIKIPPVLAISVFGRIPDVKKTVTSDIKKEGSLLYIVGRLSSDMGGSTFYDINGIVGNEVPKVDLKLLPKVLRRMHEAIKSGEILACHDVSEGGIIGSIAEMTFGGNCGVEIKLHIAFNGAPERFLFNETAGTFVVEVEDDKTANKMFSGLPYIQLGKTTRDKKINVKVGSNDLFSVSTDELKQVWKKPLKTIFG